MRVEKKRFQTPELLLQNGERLRDVVIGYETYGELNSTGDNAIFILHYFSGTSHAAGRYDEGEPEPGYWDTVIGPGKAFDTNRYFVVSADTLCNLNVKNPHVITTGPASLNPETGRPYGSSFPVVTVQDFVNVQRKLCDFLGIRHLHAVAGPSMGALQALEWSAAYPEFVDRAVCVISPGLETPAYLLATLESWCAPILLDANFRGGDYYGSAEEPREGLTAALKLVTLTAVHYGWAERLYKRRVTDPERQPGKFLDAHFSIESALTATAAERAKTGDANSFLRLARAAQLFTIAERKRRLKAKFLFLPAKSDLLMFPEYAERGAAELRELGLDVQLFELEGDGGHLDGLNVIAQASDPIRRFLDS